MADDHEVSSSIGSPKNSSSIDPEVSIGPPKHTGVPIGPHIDPEGPIGLPKHP